MCKVDKCKKASLWGSLYCPDHIPEEENKKTTKCFLEQRLITYVFGSLPAKIKLLPTIQQLFKGRFPHVCKLMRVKVPNRRLDKD